VSAFIITVKTKNQAILMAKLGKGGHILDLRKRYKRQPNQMYGKSTNISLLMLSCSQRLTFS